MERIFGAEQGVRQQWDAIERDKAASSNPPISRTDVNRATTSLVARDQAHPAARDSLMSSPVTTSERSPIPQTLNRAPGIPTTASTEPAQRSTIDQQGPRVARSRAELLEINIRDPEYRQLTKQEKHLRQLAQMQRARANAKNRRRDRDEQEERRARGD